MISNEEIKTSLEFKRRGVNQEFLQGIEVPFEWIGYNLLF